MYILPWIVQGLTLFACGALADRTFRRTGSASRSRVLPAGALLILGAVFLSLAINIPSTLGAVTFSSLLLLRGQLFPCREPLSSMWRRKRIADSSRVLSWGSLRCQVLLLPW